MKSTILKLVVALHLASVLQVGCEEYWLTPRETGKVRQKLEAFADGKLTLEEVTEVGGEDWGRKLIAYYQTHTNEVTVKMKLAVSRCYAGFGKYSDAAELSTEYLNVYSNDWRGWNILGGAKMMMRSYDEALAATTNAVRLGSEKNLENLGLAALATYRMDVFENMVLQRLLILKDSEQTSKEKKLTMITALVVYSLQADKKEVFVRALEGLDAADIQSEKRLRSSVERGCEMFKANETERLCNQLAKTDKETKAKSPKTP